MGLPGWVPIVQLLSLSAALVLAEYCPYQACDCGMFDIMCGDRGFTAMPALTSPINLNMTVAQFDRNNITRIPSGSLPANLSEISFVVVPLIAIDDDAFAGSSNTLNALTFYGANFITFPYAFKQLTALRTLSISDSSVQDWNDEVMRQIGPTVNSLALTNIRLNTWPTWLQYFTNLTELSVSGCLISDIPDGALDHLATVLTTLSITNNSLTKVPKAISTLKSLYLLFLNNNKIADLQYLPQSSKLRALALNGNKLHDAKQLSTVLRPYADTLSDLTIKSNLLTSFPDIGYLSKVYDLDFNHNKLVDANSGSLPVGISQLKMESNALPRIPRILTSLTSITQLYLGTNAITELEATAFPPLVRGCELQHNQLTQITDTSFPFNASITYILLNFNPLSSISENAFTNLPNLVELQFENTRLTRLPQALAVLNKIDDIDFSNTPSLVCTCLEKSLQEWILRLPEYKIKGTCGKTTIYYFYNFLSSGCP